MKQVTLTVIAVIFLLTSSLVSAKNAEGLMVLINSANPQTQAMAMVLSIMSIKKHKKTVNIVLCGKAGDLADKNIKSTPVKRPNDKAPSAQQNLKMLIKLGATVQVCPLYLPNASKDKSVLLKGITVAKPSKVAAKLLSGKFANISF